MYADLNTLKARAGRLASAWTTDSDPDEDDLERFLAECSATLDLFISGLGIETPLTDTNAALVLGGMAADGALVMAIEATWPQGVAPDDVGKLLEGARARWSAALSGLADGSSSIIEFIEASAETATEARATSFWIEEPFYPYNGYGQDFCYPLSGPGAYRGQGY